MTTLQQAAQQALECIERLNMRGFILADFETEVYAAITALREALEQPEQKPMHPELRKMWEDYFDKCFRTQPEPPPEWEAINNIIAEYGLDAIAFVSEWKAAQRPWQGLTDEEVQFYIKKHSKLVNAGYDKATDTNLVAKTFDSTSFYKEVSTVLKERNT
jgi:hypothetical protein